MYEKVSTDMNFVEREKDILAFWKANDIRNRSIRAAKEGTPSFTLYDGPPTANGKPHFGHIKTRVIKDVIPRFRGMKGERVEFRPDGIHMVCRLNLKLRKCWASMASLKLRAMVLSPSSKNAKSPSGSIRMNGNRCLIASVFGQIWSTLM